MIPADELVGGGAERAGNTRRRLAVGVAFGLATGVLIGNFLYREPRPPIDVPAPRVDVALPRYDVAPTKEREGTLGQGTSALPRHLSLTPTDGKRTGPVVALAQAGGYRSPIVVIGSGGTVWPIPAPLRPVREAAGNDRSPLDPRSLSPDGTRAAFAQIGEVLIVDLLGRSPSQRYPVPGLNEEVAWNGVDAVVVGSRTASHVVVLRTGEVVELPDHVRDSVFGDDGAVRLTSPGEDVRPEGAALFLRPSVSGGPPFVRTVPAVRRWYGAGHARGLLVARSGLEQGSLTPAAYVLDARSGEVLKGLRFPGRGRDAFCCQVLGWAGPDGVILSSAGSPYRLLLWHWRTGSVRILSTTREALTVSLASGTVTTSP